MEKRTEILLSDLLLDSDLAIEKLYRQHRQDFLSFGKRYLDSEEDILDIYQDAVIALIERVRKGKLKSLQSSVKTYLFSIGKFMMIDRHKLMIRENRQFTDEFTASDLVLYDTFAATETSEQLAAALRKMGHTCREILVLYYYRSYDLRSIAKSLDFKNSNVVKSYKSRCMQKLRDIFHKISN